jgi:hypothetical protein
MCLMITDLCDFRCPVSQDDSKGIVTMSQKNPNPQVIVSRRHDVTEAGNKLHCIRDACPESLLFKHVCDIRFWSDGSSRTQDVRPGGHMARKTQMGRSAHGSVLPTAEAMALLWLLRPAVLGTVAFLCRLSSKATRTPTAPPLGRLRPRSLRERGRGRRRRCRLGPLDGTTHRFQHLPRRSTDSRNSLSAAAANEC